MHLEDVYVTLNHQSKLIQKEYALEDALDTCSWYSVDWVLRVRTSDVDVAVTAKAVPNAPKEIVASCLLAGLKNVTDHWIYEGACAKLESQLAFQVDRWISPKIAEMVSIKTVHDHEYIDVAVLPTIFDYKISEPHLVVHYNETTQVYSMEMTVSINEKIKSSVEFSAELWQEVNHECLSLGKSKLVESLYDQYPELSHLWTQIRYNWFSMSEMSPQSVAWIKKVQGSAIQWQADEGYFFLKKADVNGLKPNYMADIHYLPTSKAFTQDRRVDLLPGLEEFVVNPQTGKCGTLKSVIISLNDTSKWTREQIADWLETLDVDITFKTKEDNE